MRYIMYLQKLANWPSRNKIRMGIILALSIIIIFLILMQIYYDLSNYPVLYMESQLSFSGAVIKSHFSTMSEEEIGYYVTWLLLDYGFMLGYGLLLFCLSLMISRKLEEGSSLNQLGFILTLFGPVAACCDGIENFFILLMTTNPSGFPDIWAITHSIFALIKFMLMYITIGWIIIALIIRLAKKSN